MNRLEADLICSVVEYMAKGLEKWCSSYRLIKNGRTGELRPMIQLDASSICTRAMTELSTSQPAGDQIRTYLNESLGEDPLTSP